MDTLNQSILTAIVALVGVIVTVIRVVGPAVDHMVEVWAQQQSARIEAHWPESVRRALQEAAVFGAQAAEQAGLAKLITNAANTKKAYAVAAAERWLRAQGYTVDLSTLGDAIETVILQGLHLPTPAASGTTPKAA
ncbi:MAG: hypothetical protein ACYDBJ_04515 [Aggregatilineales bacterium]